MDSHALSIISNQELEKVKELTKHDKKIEAFSDSEIRSSDKLDLSGNTELFEKYDKILQSNNLEIKNNEDIPKSIRDIKKVTLTHCSNQNQFENSKTQELENVQNEKLENLHSEKLNTIENVSKKKCDANSPSKKLNVLLTDVKKTKAVSGKSNKIKSRWSDIINNEQYSSELNVSEKDVPENTESKFCSQINKTPEKHNNVTVTFSSFEQFWEEHLSKKQLEQNSIKLKINEKIVNDKKCDNKYVDSLNDYKLKNQSKEIKNSSENASSLFSSDINILPNDIPLPTEHNSDCNIPNIPLPTEAPKSLLIVDIPLPNHEPQEVICKNDSQKTDLIVNDFGELVNVEISKKKDLNEILISNDNKYYPEDTFNSVCSSSEQIKESLTIKPVLGRVQAKKRLQAFSLIKQNNKMNKKLLSPNIKSPKIQVSIIAEEQYNENGEKVGDKVILKKPPKKGPCPQEKAKAVISEIEEMKRHEAKMLLLNSKPGLYSLIAASQNKPPPVKSMPIPTEPKLINFNEQTAKEIKSLIEKVVSEEVGGGVSSNIKSDTSSCTKTQYHDEKIIKGSRDRDHDRSIEKRKSSDKQKSNTSKSNILDKHSEKIKKPSSWSDIKEWGYDYVTIRDTKDRPRRNDENKDKFGLEIQLKSFDKDVILRYPFPVKSIKNEDIWFPRENIRYTTKSPTLSWSENPVKYRNYPNRKQVLSVISEECKNTINEFLKRCERPEKYETLSFESQLWYPSNNILNRSLLQDNIKMEIPKIKSYGLSVLNENYKSTNWCDSEEEKIENLSRKPKHFTNKELDVTFETHNSHEDELIQNKCNNNKFQKSLGDEKSELNYKSSEMYVYKENNLLDFKQSFVKKSKCDDNKIIPNVVDNLLSSKSITKIITKDLISEQDLNDGAFIHFDKKEDISTSKSEYVESPNTDEYLPSWEMEKDVLLPIEPVSKSFHVNSLSWESDDDNPKQNVNEYKESKKTNKRFIDNTFKESPIDIKSNLFCENKKYVTVYSKYQDPDKYNTVNFKDNNLFLRHKTQNMLFKNDNTIEQEFGEKIGKEIEGKTNQDNEYRNESRDSSESIENHNLKVNFLEHKKPVEIKFHLDKNEYLSFKKRNIFETMSGRKHPEMIELEKCKERVQKVSDFVDSNKMEIRQIQNKYNLQFNSLLNVNQKIDNYNDKMLIDEINNSQYFYQKTSCNFNVNDSKRSINLLPVKVCNSQNSTEYIKKMNDTVNENVSKISLKSNKTYIEDLSFQKSNVSYMSDWEEEELQECHLSKGVTVKKYNFEETNSEYETGKDILSNWTEQNICDFRMKEKDNSVEQLQKKSIENISDDMLQNTDYYFQLPEKENMNDIRHKNENLLSDVKSPEINEQNKDFICSTNVIDSSFININSKLASEYEEFMKTVAFIETSELSESVANEKKCTNNVNFDEKEFNEIKDTFLEDKVKVNKKILDEEICHSLELPGHNENVIQERPKQNKTTYKKHIVNYKHKKYKITSSSSSSNSSDTSSSSESDSSSETDSSTSSSSDSSSSSSSSSSCEHKNKKCDQIKIKTEKESDEEIDTTEINKTNFIENDLFDSATDNSYINISSKLDKETVKIIQKPNLLSKNDSESVPLLTDTKTSILHTINDNFNDLKQNDVHKEVKISKGIQFSEQTSDSKFDINSFSDFKKENETINSMNTKQIDFSMSFKVANLPLSSEQFTVQKSTVVNMFPDNIKFNDSNKSTEAFSEEINFSNINLTTPGLSLYGENADEHNISNSPKKTYIGSTDTQSLSMQKLRQFIPIKLLTNESRIQSFKLNSLMSKNANDLKELQVEQHIKFPVKQINSPQLELETQVDRNDKTDIDFSNLLTKINIKPQTTLSIREMNSEKNNDQVKNVNSIFETSLQYSEKEVEKDLKNDSSPKLKKDCSKTRIEFIHRESSSDNECRKNNYRSDDKKYIRKDYDKHTDKERRKSVDSARRSKNYIRDKKYYDSDRDRYKSSRERSREVRRRDWRSNRDKEKYKRDRSRSSGDTKRNRTPVDDRSRRIELIPLPDRLQSLDKSNKNMKFNLDCSPNSPTGIKCSVADSTISDSELPIQTLNDDQFGVIQESPRFLEKSYKSLLLSPRSVSPKSPKRISLDDRINQVLGIEKELPKPIDTVYSQGSYSNYQMEYYEPYQNYLQTSNYDIYETPLKGSVNNSNYYNSYGSNIDSIQSHCTTRVLQVGNVLQVVPSESSHHDESVCSKQKATNNTTKVVQVGNMLQIVPTITTPSDCTPINQTITSTSDKGDITSIPLIGVEKEIMLKKVEKQKRRAEREERRQERQRKKIEKEKKRELKIKLKNENMIKRALMLESEDGISELNSIETNKTNFSINSDIKEDDEQPLMWPPPVLTPVPLPQPPAKGILVSPGFSKLSSISNDSPLLSLTEVCIGNPIRKSVKFADGICPGEGTSPSGGEELPSPPPPPRKLPKEQRYKKTKLRSKKKVKVKIIRSLPIPPAPPPEESDDDEDELPPPPPPPGSPPPHLWPPNSHINNTHPSINNIPPYTVQQIPTTNPSFIQYSTRTTIHSNMNMMYASPIDSAINSPYSVGSTFSSHPGFQSQTNSFSPATNISTGLSSNYPGQQSSTRLAFNIPVIGANNMRSNTSAQPHSNTYHPPAFPITPVGTSTQSFSSPPSGILVTSNVLTTKSTRKSQNHVRKK